jgi:hypothetical protein
LIKLNNKDKARVAHLLCNKKIMSIFNSNSSNNCRLLRVTLEKVAQEHFQPFNHYREISYKRLTQSEQVQTHPKLKDSRDCHQ